MRLGRLTLLLALLLGACRSLVGFEDYDAAIASGSGDAATPTIPEGGIPTPDAGARPDATLLPEAGSVARKCPVGTPFAATRMPVLGLPSAHYTVVRHLSDDEKTVYFATTSRFDAGPEKDETDIYRGTRQEVGEPFDNFESLTAINTDKSELEPTVGANGIYFTQINAAAGSYSILQAPLTGAGATVFLSESLTSLVHMPYLDGTGSILYFSRKSLLAADESLVQMSATKGPDSLLGLKPDGGLSLDESPTVSRDGREIFFASNRFSGTDMDIWVATVSDSSVSFSNPTRLATLATSVDEFPQWISPDGCTLYIAWADNTGFLNSYYVTR